MKNIAKPNIIFINCDIAYGNQEPPPALNKTIIEKSKTTIIGINKSQEKRESFSPKVIILALDTRVVDIYFNNSFIIFAAACAAGEDPPACSIITHTAYLGLSVGA